MGSMQQAVLEFDQAVQAPWRPLLGTPPGSGRPRHLRALPSPASGSPLSPPLGVRLPSVRLPPPPRPGPAGRGSHARPSSRRPERRPAPPLRLTRRARRLATVLTLGAGVALGSWLAPLVSGTDPGGLQLVGESSVVVQRGDTLWSIASSVAGDEDVRAVVDEIQRLNGLEGTTLTPGRLLRLP